MMTILQHQCDGLKLRNFTKESESATLAVRLCVQKKTCFLFEKQCLLIKALEIFKKGILAHVNWDNFPKFSSHVHPLLDLCEELAQ
jgi:hypothetical protein